MLGALLLVGLGIGMVMQVMVRVGDIVAPVFGFAAPLLALALVLAVALPALPALPLRDTAHASGSSDGRRA